MNSGPRVVRRVEAGAGQPVVVLEAGLNNGAASWERVMPLLAPHVRVVAYDRAGVGGSAPAPDLVTIDRQIDDLASVITGLGAGPCVLAGHSWGGVLVQLLAFRRPELVAGLILVDPGHEEMDSALPLPIRWGWRIKSAVFPDELHGDAPVTLAAVRELRARARSFPDVPVVVLSAARGFPRRFRANWTRLQAGLAAAAPQGRHVVVDGTGHDIPGNRPDVVAGAILEVAVQVRASASANLIVTGRPARFVRGKRSDPVFVSFDRAAGRGRRRRAGRALQVPARWLPVGLATTLDL